MSGLPQLSLFVRAPYSEPGTSRDAAVAIGPHLERLEAAVLAALRASGGLCAHEVEEATGIAGNTVRPRLVALRGQGAGPAVAPDPKDRQRASGARLGGHMTVPVARRWRPGPIESRPAPSTRPSGRPTTATCTPRSSKPTTPGTWTCSCWPASFGRSSGSAASGSKSTGTTSATNPGLRRGAAGRLAFL